MSEMEQPSEGKKPKHVMTEEHKAKIKEGRARARERKRLKLSTQQVEPVLASKPISPEIIVPKTDIKLFGPVDKHRSGRNRSEYPAYYFEEHMNELKRSVEDKESQLDQDLIPGQAKTRYRARLREEKERLDQIKESIPKLSGAETDLVVETRKKMGEKIKEAKFTRSDEEKGLADAHEEARRMSEPCMKIESDFEAHLAKEIGVTPRGGMVSRTDMERMWKISSRLIGEPSDTEYLRRQ
mgnify:FL=1